MGLRFAEVTKETRPDFEALFQAKGGPSYCWCMAWREMHTREHVENAEKKRLMVGRIAGGTPVGILAYDADDPIGGARSHHEKPIGGFRACRTIPNKASGRLSASMYRAHGAAPDLRRRCWMRRSIMPSQKALGRLKPTLSSRLRQVTALWASVTCFLPAVSLKPARPAPAGTSCA